MHVTLNVAERLHLLSVLPERGPFATAKIVHELVDLLGVGNEEATALGYQVQPDGRRTWRPSQEGEPKAFELVGFQLDLVRARLRAVEARDDLTPPLYALWEKLEVGDPDPREEPAAPNGAGERPRDRLKGATP